MDQRPVLFLDSGMGGIPYCRHFGLRNPGETLVYIADCQNFPYGQREKQELAILLSNLVEKTIRLIDPKIFVIACNTATISALEHLRRLFPLVPFVGTVPAIKPAILASKTKNIGVLGTGRTIDDPYIRELAALFGPCELHGIAAPELVDFVEKRLSRASIDEKKEIARSFIERFRSQKVDVLVLGCTHFLFLLDEFRDAGLPDILVIDSLDGITRRIESLLDADDGKLRSQKNPAKNRLLLTGTDIPDSSWQNHASELDFYLGLLE